MVFRIVLLTFLLGVSISACTTQKTVTRTTCVAGCFNEWCPGTYDFCSSNQGACAPVPCASEGDCVGLDACDRSVRNSKTFTCDRGYCRRVNTTCLNECSSNRQCGENEFCFCSQGTCCWCDVHICKLDSDCNALNLSDPYSRFGCSNGICVRQ